jgi:hypothetical protein
MKQLILDTDSLPQVIRENFKSPQVRVEFFDKGITLLPFYDLTKYCGVFKGSKLTVEKLLEYGQEDKELEDNQL